MFKKLNGCENEKTVQKGAVGMLRLGRCLGRKVCHLCLAFVRLLSNDYLMILKGGASR